MRLNRIVHQRLKSLRLNLNEVDKFYTDLKMDYIKDTGIDYNTWYPDNEETRILFKRADDLYSLRKDQLFTAIFNFSQTFYSLKEYLIVYDPIKEGLIEDFFSNEKTDMLSRKQIANDLKHDPNNDLIFDSRVVKNEIIKEPGKITHISYLSHSWFYRNLETVEYCQRLYKELLTFLEKSFK